VPESAGHEKRAAWSVEIGYKTSDLDPSFVFDGLWRAGDECHLSFARKDVKLYQHVEIALRPSSPNDDFFISETFETFKLAVVFCIYLVANSVDCLACGGYYFWPPRSSSVPSMCRNLPRRPCIDLKKTCTGHNCGIRACHNVNIGTLAHAGTVKRFRVLYSAHETQERYTMW
jgi:hypothetical protein